MANSYWQQEGKKMREFLLQVCLAEDPEVIDCLDKSIILGDVEIPD